MQNGRRFLALLTLAALLGAAGCADTPEAPYVPLEQNGDMMVALGNSLTAGYHSGGLLVDAQEACFANLIGQAVTGRPLQQPLVAAPGIGNESGYGLLEVLANGSIGRQPIPGGNPMALLLNATYPRPYQNLGVPGATTHDVTTATDATTSQSPGNLYFDLILRNSALPPYDATQLSSAQSIATGPAQALKLLTLWIGNNDILGGATSGNPVFEGAGTNVTPAALYQQMLQGIFAAVDALGFEMVAVANIPASLPYFHTVPLGTNIPDHGFVPWVTEEENVQYVLLPAVSIVGSDYLPAPFGAGEELGSQYTLTGDEMAGLQATIDAYNDILADAVATRGWALVDAHAEWGSWPALPLPANFATLNAIFPWGPYGPGGSYAQNQMSAFGLDGIHLSERGNARMANVFLSAVNAHYGTDYALVNEAAVVNTIGFTNAPAKAAAADLFSEDGRRGLASVVELLSSRR